MIEKASITLSILFAVFFASACEAQISFGLQDYAELDNIRSLITPVFQELDLSENAVRANLNASNLVGSSISALSPAVTTVTGQIVVFINDGNTLLSAASAGNLESAISNFSFLDLSSARTELASLNQRISTLDSQLETEIPLPSSQWFTAGVVSNRARSEMIEIRSLAVNSRQSLTTVGGQVFDRIDDMNALRDRVTTGERVANEIARAISAAPLLTTAFAASAVATAGDFANFRRNEIAATLRELNDLNSPIEERLSELDDLIDGIDNVLASETLPSSWVGSAQLLDGTSEAFALSFNGHSFNHPTTEIDGEFTVGVVSIRNNVSSGTGRTLTRSLLFTVERTVQDPSLGTQVTFGDVDALFTYTATTNTDDPSASADIFSIQGVATNIHVLEETTATIQDLGRYDSPLRITGVRIAPGSEDFAFLTPGAILADVNLDEVVTFADIPPFLEILTTGVFQVEADCDQNGTVDEGDIARFIEILMFQ